MLILVTGPVRAGKSARAAALATATGKPVIFAATAALDPADPEMADRIARHRRERPPSWSVVETAGTGAPSLANVVRDAPAGACVLVDALGTWIAAQLVEWSAWAERDAVATLDALDERGSALLDALEASCADAIVIAEETGWGVVPPTPLGRIFRDALGRLTRAIAGRAERVELVVAGYALDVRALGTPVDEV